VRNLIVPVVGNFAGLKALHGIGDYVRSHGAVVSAFYVSEVEPYLSADNLLPRFCANLAALPIAGASVLIRPPTVSVTSTAIRFAAAPLPDVHVMPTIASELKTCAARTGGFVVDLPLFR
jgi:hypothetical protein